MNSLFSDVTYKQLRTLLTVIGGLNEKKLERANLIYRQKEVKFDSTLELAKGLKLLTTQNGYITVDRKIQSIISKPNTGGHDLKRIVLNSALTSGNDFKSEIELYLNKFEIEKDSFEYKPSPTENIEYSGIRNFLVEIGLVEYNHKKKTYFIVSNYVDRFLTRFKDTSLHPDELKFLQRKKDELGKSAELAVLDFEIKRLSKHPKLISNIQHVANKNVMAGYDIKSWEVDSKGGNRIKERYIEVKAVSNDDLKFYWSKNEIDKAKSYGKKYYLYLLPVIDDKKFDVDNLKIIQNPYASVFKSDEWDRQIENYLFKSSRKK